jgi:uracil-DNA glycosylase family 4
MRKRASTAARILTGKRRATRQISPARARLNPEVEAAADTATAVQTSAVLKKGSAANKAGAIKILEQLAARIRTCTRCPLYKSRTNAVPGEGKANARVMIVGEAPGKQEDQSGQPFVGSAGRYLEHVFAGTGLEREDFFITNIVKCRPPSNRTPRTVEVDTCTSLYLFRQIELVNPKFVLLLGSVAVKKLLGLGNVEVARGRFIEHDGRKYLATYHPAVRFYREDLAKKLKADFALLKQALRDGAAG